jgi:hypothetical protein
MQPANGSATIKAKNMRMTPPAQIIQSQPWSDINRRPSCLTVSQDFQS